MWGNDTLLVVKKSIDFFVILDIVSNREGKDMKIGTPAYEQIRDILRSEIISGKISAESQLSILEISKRFEVSQMPVREALQWLQGEGLLIGIPHKGVRVISIDAQFIKNVFEVRGAIEALLAQTSLPLILDSDIQRLGSINEAFSKSIGNCNVEDVLSADKEFHLTIYKKSENMLAFEIYQKYRDLIITLRKQYGFTPHRVREMIDQHAQIIKALRSKDELHLDALIKEHRKGALIDLLDHKLNTERTIHNV